MKENLYLQLSYIQYKLIYDIDMTEKQFNRLSKKNKRIAIAKDVIAQIKAEKIYGAGGNFIRSAELSNYLSKLRGKRSLQELLPNYTCAVCAKGALFYSDIINRNNYNVSTYFSIQNDDCVDKLDYFDKIQLDLIEIAFEGQTYEHSDTTLRCASSNGNAYKIILGAINFGRKHFNGNDRLKAIMQNIIDNDGTFLPVDIEL